MGGMGTVWSAEHTQTGRSFALKIMHPTVATSDDSRERFLKEAKASARINHPNVIDVLDVGELPDGGLFMAMELLEGLALSDALRLDPPLSMRELLVVIRAACAALAAAHGVGIIHRDVKPANIFLHRDRQTGQVRPKLLDFGVSKFAFLDESNTHTGSLLGSPRYMSPEQSRSATQADQRSDVWSIGVILFEGLIGSYPHDGDSFSNLVVAIATTPPRSAQSAVPSADRALTTLIDDCLRTRDQRITSCEVLGARIDDILATRDLDNVPCARGKSKKSVSRPSDFVIQAMEPQASGGRSRSMLAMQRVVDEPSTHPTSTHSHGRDGGDATSLFVDPGSAATRLHTPPPAPLAGAGPSSILGPVPSRTMAAPPGGPLGEALSARARGEASAGDHAGGPPRRPGLPGGAQTRVSLPSRPLRPPPPSPGHYQEATLIHTRVPQGRESSRDAPPGPPVLRTTVPMNAGLVAPPLSPPPQRGFAPTFEMGESAATQLISYPQQGGLAPSSLGLVTEPRDQLVESVSTSNVERYRPGATPQSAPPPNDVETTASRDRNRRAGLLIVFGGASVVALAFIVILLMGRLQGSGPASAADGGNPTDKVARPAIEPAPPAAADPAPDVSPVPPPSADAAAEASADTLPGPSPGSSAAPATSASANAPASAPPAASSAPPAWAPPPGAGSNRPYPPPGRMPQKKDCSKDPIGCLDPQLR